MNRRREGLWVQQQQSTGPSPPLPADHVLFSGAVTFPGAFDQLGCPLVVFPVARQAQISSTLSKPEVVDFIDYCLHQHNKTQKSGLVSVVADLREASSSTTRFIAETLLLLELQKKTVHSAYIIQPRKRDALRLLVKLWTTSKTQPVAFKKVLLKEVFELSNYVDRSQLPASLGGYLVYSHQSWAVFTKEMDAFTEHFVSVSQRLPGCLSSLQALSMLPLPSAAPELQLFCSANEARFQQLQRELGLNDLLRHCEHLQEKLGSPELDPHFLAMTGTALFTQYVSVILQNRHRITAVVKKVELLWQEAFSKARLQLHVLQLRDDALQITEQIERLLQHNLQPYDIQIGADAAEAERLTSEFHSSVYTPAMSLVAAAEQVVCTLTEVLSDAPSRERWLLDLHRLKEKLHTTIHLTLQTLRAVSKYHLYFNKARSWYLQVLSENFLQKLLSEVNGQRMRKSFGTLPIWRRRLCTFLNNSPPPNSEELVHLAHLSNVIPDKRLQQEGMQVSQRCMTLRRLIISTEPLTVAEIQVALQWQYELLRSSMVNQSLSSARCVQLNPESTHTASPSTPVCRRDSQLTADRLRSSTTAEGKPSSLSSFDSGFGGAGSLLEGPTVPRDCAKQTLNQPQIKEDVASVSDSDWSESLGNSSRASVRLRPKAPVSALNFEIKVKRSAAHPSNPWLSLPGDDLENSYSVSITPGPMLEHGNMTVEDPSALPSAWHTHTHLEDSELCPIAHVLSSTITDPKDQTYPPVDPSLLWDSYDLHEQYLDATESTLSLKDWDIKEQENLTEVERILERADKILAEEEGVFVQEAELEDLLQNEMSSELTIANVLGKDQAYTESKSGPGIRCFPAGSGFKPDLISELKEVHALDQRILEENLKIHQLRQEESLEEKMQTNCNAQSEQGERVRLAKEQLDQENLETSMGTCLTEHKGQPARVIRCSITSRSEREEDKYLCSDLLSGRTHSRTYPEPTCRAESLCHKSDSIGSGKDSSSGKAVCGNGLGQKDEKLKNSSDRQLSEFRASQNPLVTRSDLAQSVPDPLSVTQKSSGRAEAPHPIPKPRKALMALNKLTKRLGVRAVDGHDISPKNGAPARDSREAVAPTVDTLDAGQPALNAVSRLADTLDAGLPAVEALDTGTLTLTRTATPAVDAVTPAAETGTTVAEALEAGTPAGDAVTLAGDTADTLGTGTPVVDAVTPAMHALKAQAAALDAGTSAADDVDVRMPALDTGASAVDRLDTETPAGGAMMPSGDTGTRTADAPDAGTPVVRALMPLVSALDAGTPAADALDAGTPVADALDAGTPVADALDAGTPAADALDGGTTAADALDGGTPAADALDGGTPAADALDAGTPATDALDAGTPAADALDAGTPAADALDAGTHALDAGRPTVGTVDPPVEDGALSLGLKVELHTNNNNNNNNMPVSVTGAGETPLSEVSQIVPPTCRLVNNLEMGDNGNWCGGTKMSAPGIQDQFSSTTTLPADFETPIVLDTGSGLMKAGFADQDLPSVVFPTIIGVPKYEEIMNGSSEKDLYVGHEAQHMRGVLALRHPIKYGLIHNWDDMEKLWQHTFDYLRADPADHPVLLTEAPMNPLENKQRAVEIMFEYFGVPFCYIAMQSVLALYAAGRTTGVVVDSGNGVTHSVPVYDGYTLSHAMQRFPLAGADITANLTKLLQEQGVSMRTSAEQEIVCEMKEKCCCVALDYEAALREGGACREMSYTLPDGRMVTLGLERIRAPEILFKPELIGRDHCGLHESVYKSILNSDLDLRRCFLGNILLSGGNTLLPGLPERLEMEVSGLVPHEPRPSVRVCSPSDRDFSVWRGGAVLASLPSFCGAWIGQSEYDEHGPQIVHRKCF